MSRASIDTPNAYPAGKTFQSSPDSYEPSVADEGDWRGYVMVFQSSPDSYEPSVGASWPRSH